MWYQKGKSLYNVCLPEYAGTNDKGEALYYVDTDNVDASGKQYTDRPGHKRDATTTNYSESTYYEQGSSLPDLFGGFSTSLRIGDFDASVTFDYQIGGKLYDQRYSSLMTPNQNSSGAGGNFHKDYIKSWTPDDPCQDVPRWQFGDKYTTARSTRFLTDASYLNFQSFTVGYTLPKFWKEISNMRVYVMGENLCFWSKRKGFDPRYGFSGNGSLGTYSPARNISGGIQVNF